VAGSVADAEGRATSSGKARRHFHGQRHIDSLLLAVTVLFKTDFLLEFLLDSLRPASGFMTISSLMINYSE
jgi:hypothetical protein